MYGQKLPDGLIRSGVPYPSSDKDDQLIPMDDMAKLWRAHFVMKSAQPSEIGARLEYFFWRLMGNPRLCQTLRESQIARFHATISRDIPIRTTPSQSPMRADLPKDGRDMYVTDSGFLSDSRLLGDAEMSRTGTSAIKASITRDRSTSRPRPILRTPGIDTSHSGKSARILTPTWGSNAKGKLPFRGEMFDVRDSSLKIQSSSTTSEDGASDPHSDAMVQEPAIPATFGSPSKSPRRNSSFAVGSKRRRPSMPNKRSSQSASNTNSKPLEPASSQALPNSLQTQQQVSANPSPTTSNQTAISPKDRTTSSIYPSAPVPPESSPTSQTQSEPHSAPTTRHLSTSPNPPTTLNPQMRAISTKSALSTGLSSISPVTASLQPFTDQAHPVHLSIRTPARSGTHLASATQSDIDTLNRSRENLNQLLERDHRRTSGQKKGRKL